MKPIFLFCFLSILSFSVKSRQAPWDGQYRFRDGIYLTSEQWSADAPQSAAEQRRIELGAKSTFDLLRVRKIETLTGESRQRVSPGSLWGLALEGVPYIRMGGDLNETFFQRIFQLGRICYFAYRRPDPDPGIQRQPVSTSYQDGSTAMPGFLPGQQILMNPDNARNKKRNRKSTATPWLLSPLDGRLLEATPENLSLLLADDPELADAFAREADPHLQVFRYVLRYNERNPYYPK